MATDPTPVSFENTEIAFSSKSGKELKRTYWLFKLFNNLFLVNSGKKIFLLANQLHLPVSPFVKSNIFKQFCGGENYEETAKTVARLAEYGLKTDLAYSVEAKNKEKDFEQCYTETIRLINKARNNSGISFISVKVTGYARLALLEKINAKKELSDWEKNEFAKVTERTDKICKAADDCGKIIFMDAEESWIQQPIDDLATAMMKKHNGKRAVVYNTIQLYRWDRLDFLKQSYHQAVKEGYVYGVKIVRGAYMEKERLRARKMNYPSPIHLDKNSTDRDYDEAISFCVNHPNTALCVATHNEESCMQMVRQVEKNKIAKNNPNVFCGQLYGMSDHISFNLSNAGYNVAKYVPYGPIREVIPYLIRRAEENTSIAGQMGRELKLIKKEMERRKGR